MSNAEFRDHIKAIVGPAPKGDRPCVRKPTDLGYWPEIAPSPVPGLVRFNDYCRGCGVNLARHGHAPECENLPETYS